MISIGIINHNKNKFIASCIQSCLKQSVQANIIIIDNHSTDGSVDTIKNSIKGTNITLTQNLENLGSSFARNQILMAATTPYVLFVDGDDLLYFSAVEDYQKAIQQAPNCLCFYSDYDVNDIKSNQMVREFSHPFDARLLFNLPYIHSNSCFQVDALRKLGGFNNKIWGGETFEVLLKLAKQGMMWHVPKSLFMYRIDGNNFNMMNQHIVIANMNRARQEALTQQ